MRYARFQIDNEPRFGVLFESCFVDLVGAAEASGRRELLGGFGPGCDAPTWIARGDAGRDAARTLLASDTVRRALATTTSNETTTSSETAASGDAAAASGDGGTAGVHRIDTLRRLAPIARPGKIVAVGRNYADHCAEQNQEPPKKPLFFIKLASSVIGDRNPIRFRRDVTDKVDYEAELAVVIGRGGCDIPLEHAMDHVFGYTVVNDVTARDLQKSDKQWSRAKGLDTFCPMGPCVVTADEIPDPHALDIRSFVNGAPRQSSNTRHLIFDIPTLIHRLSQCVTLEPGDVIPTGTPGGVGCYLDPPAFLAESDEVRVEVEGIGAISNPVREV